MWSSPLKRQSKARFRIKSWPELISSITSQILPQWWGGPAVGPHTGHGAQGYRAFMPDSWVSTSYWRKLNLGSTGPPPNSTDGEAEVKQEGLQFIALTIITFWKKKCLSSTFWFETRNAELKAASEEQTFISGTFPSSSVIFIPRHFHKAEKGEDIHTGCLPSSKAKVCIPVYFNLKFIISQKWLKISSGAKCGNSKHTVRWHFVSNFN